MVTNEQLYILVGVPILFNATMIGLLIAVFNAKFGRFEARFDSIDKRFEDVYKRQGKLFAYAVAQAGSDWREWRVRDVATGKDSSDLIQWTKAGSVAWTADDRAFYYTRRCV